MMLKRIIAALSLAVAATAAISISSMAVAAAPVASEAPLQLAANAPERYVVVRGDTLWGISGKFLNEPWRWPEIWRMNADEIKNPHLIYPGDVILVSYDGSGRPYLSLSRSGARGSAGPGGTVRLGPKVHEESIDQAIPSIPVQEIRPFMREPLVLDSDTLDGAPRIAATEEDKVYIGNGDVAYVMGLDSEEPLWHVYRKGKNYTDPDSGEYLGSEAVYVGMARLTRFGEPSVIEVISSKLEMGVGDRLMAAPEPEVINYVPHAPSTEIEGRVLGIYGTVEGSVGEAGPFSIISITKGIADGIDVGTTLALYTSQRVRSRSEDGRANIMLDIPEERYGLVFIFRVFDRISYGLVSTSKRSTRVGDIVRNPF